MSMPAVTMTLTTCERWGCFCEGRGCGETGWVWLRRWRWDPAGTAYMLPWKLLWTRALGPACSGCGLRQLWEHSNVCTATGYCSVACGQQ